MCMTVHRLALTAWPEPKCEILVSRTMADIWTVSELLTGKGSALFNGCVRFEIEQEKKGRNARIVLYMSGKISIMRSNF